MNPLEFAWKKHIAISRIAIEFLISICVFYETGMFTASAIFLISLSIEMQSYVKYREFVNRKSDEAFINNVGKIMSGNNYDFAELGKKLKIKITSGTAKISTFDKRYESKDRE